MAHAHEPGCDLRHAPRQRCNVPLGEAHPRALQPAATPAGAVSASPVHPEPTEAPAPAAAPPRAQPPAYAPRAMPLPTVRNEFRPYDRARRQRGLHPVLRWAAATLGTVTLLVALIVAGVAIDALTSPDVHVERAVAAILVCVALALLLGIMPLYFATGAYAQVVGAILALVLVTGGVTMLVMAPVLRQMNSPGIAEYRAFTALTWCGVLSTIAGLVFAAFFFRWTMRKDARRRLARWALGAGAGYGVLLALTGLLLLQGFARAVSDAGTDDDVFVVAAALGLTAVATFSLVPGIIITYHAISGAMGEGSSEFHLPSAAPLALGFGAVLLLGHLVMRAATPVAAPMPALHVIAGALPPLAFVALALRGSFLRGRPLRSVSWRQATMAAGVSMTVATTIAIYIEAGGGISAVVLMLVRADAFAGARNGDAVRFVLENPEFWLSWNEQIVASLITASILAPISEEIGKSLAVRFTMRPNSSRAECFLLGAAAGAAFGFLESLLYGSAAVNDDPGNWALAMLVRGGSTSLHVICSGVAGVGWWYWTRAREHRTALSLFAGAILLHAGWNAFATLVESRIFLEDVDDRTLEIVFYSIIAVVSAAMIAAIPLLARRLRDRPVDVSSAMLPSMAPWLG